MLQEKSYGDLSFLAPDNEEPISAVSSLPNLSSLAPTEGGGESFSPSFGDLSSLAPDPVDPLSSTSSFNMPELGTREQGRTRQEVQAADITPIREYMVRRKGQQFINRSDDEVYDAFVNHMRFMNVNEVTTLGEITWSNKASEEDKAIAAQAYDAYNSLGNVFVNDGVAGAFDGIADYGRAILTSPSTYLGGIVGRLTVGSAATAGRVALTQAAGKSAVEAAKASARVQAASRGLTGAAVTQAAEEVGVATAKKVAGDAARRASLQQIAVAGGVDAGTGVLQDYMYQRVMMDSGVQGDYSVLQSGIAAVGGVVGAGVASVPYALKGVSGLSEAQTNIMVSFNAAREANLERLKPAVEEGFKKLKGDVQEWVDAAKRGEIAVGDSRELERKVVDELLQGENSIFNMFGEARFIFDDGPNAAPKTAQLIQALQQVGLPREVDEIFQKEIGISLGTALEIAQNSVRQGAIDLNAASQGIKHVSAAARAAQRIQEEAAEEMAGQAAKRQPDPDARTIEYIASVWRRTLVSHPATTAVNVQGWLGATAAGTIAQLMHGGTVGTVGLAAKMASPFSSKANRFADAQLLKAGRIMKAEAFQLSTLLDPITAKESFQALINSPNISSQNKAILEESIFGGIDATGPVSYKLAQSGPSLKRGSVKTEVRELQKLLGIEETGLFNEATEEAVKKLQRSYGFPDTGIVGRQEWAALSSTNPVKQTEKTLNKFAQASGVKLQDMYTKANSFLYALNKESLKKYNKPLGQVIEEGNAFELTEDMFEAATKEALMRTFSADLTRNLDAAGPLKRPLESLYRFTEQLSNLPGIGFLFPFGRFVNNNLNFLFMYNPLGLFRDLPAMLGKESTEEVMERGFKRVTGLAAIAYFADFQAKNEEEGKAWNQVEDLQGDISDRTNVAPVSFYMLAGRIWNSVRNGEEVPEELLYELRQQMGLDFVQRGVTDTTDGLFEAIGYMANALQDGGDVEDLKQAVTVISQSMMSVASGFTRPLEPINVAAGYGTGNMELIDRRQLSGTDALVAEALRYTDRLFQPILERVDPESVIVNRPEVQNITQEGSAYATNELSRMFGTRLAAPMTSGDKMLAAVDLPNWRAQSRSDIAGLDAAINDRASTLLNNRAQSLMRTPAWRDGSKAQRRLLVNEVLSGTKREVQEWIGQGSIEDATLVAQRNWTRQNARYRSAAKEYFGLSDIKDTDLTYSQIQMMKDWIKWYRGSLSDTTGNL